MASEATLPQNRHRHPTAKPCPLHAGLGPTTTWPNHNRRPPLPQNAFASEGHFAKRSRPSPRRRNAFKRTFRAHASPPLKTPRRHPKPAFSLAQTAALRKPLLPARWRPDGPRARFWKAPRRFNPRLRPAFHHRPNGGAHRFLCRPPRLNALTVHAPGLFQRLRPPAPAPPRSKRPFVRCARFDLERCLPFSPPAGPSDLPPAFRTFAFPCGRLRPKPTPPRPAFTRHDFRFHHHRPNDCVSGTACFPRSIVGDAPSP